MTDTHHETRPAVQQRATSPLAGAIAGVLFAITFSASLSIIMSTMSELPTDTGAWLAAGAARFRFAIGLFPFAGLFFLWFIAVSRQHLGRHEDQFFATVFLGSGLLFLAMMFSAAAVAGALVAGYARDPESFANSSTYWYARDTAAQLFNILALRMAAVFQISGATLWLRTGVMPRWLAVVTYGTAVILLFVVTQSRWVFMVFPAWVLLVSVYIIVTHLRSPRAANG